MDAEEAGASASCARCGLALDDAGGAVPVEWLCTCDDAPPSSAWWDDVIL